MQPAAEQLCLTLTFDILLTKKFEDHCKIVPTLWVEILRLRGLFWPRQPTKKKLTGLSYCLLIGAPYPIVWESFISKITRHALCSSSNTITVSSKLSAFCHLFFFLYIRMHNLRYHPSGGLFCQMHRPLLLTRCDWLLLEWFKVCLSLEQKS